MKYIISIGIIATVVFLDLAGTFSYSDIPFLALLLTFLMGRKITFSISLFLLAWTFLSYIPTGAGAVTERIGEWFFLFLICGLIQSIRRV